MVGVEFLIPHFIGLYLLSSEIPKQLTMYGLDSSNFNIISYHYHLLNLTSTYKRQHGHTVITTVIRSNVAADYMGEKK
jgi:hypothetical protein